jgi:hypothetical protein
MKNDSDVERSGSGLYEATVPVTFQQVPRTTTKTKFKVAYDRTNFRTRDQQNTNQEWRSLKMTTQLKGSVKAGGRNSVNF